MTSALAPNGDASVPGKDEKPSSDVPVIDDDTAERAREIRNEVSSRLRHYFATLLGLLWRCY